MREVERKQLAFGELPIAQIEINPKSRDDTPAVLLGLKHIYMDDELREKVFALLEAHILPDADRTTGRPGMPLWNILVLGVVKQGLGCDYDHLHELANEHRTMRKMMGHAEWLERPYNSQTIVDNVSILNVNWPKVLIENCQFGDFHCSRPS